MAVTPLSLLWFQVVTGLEPALAAMGVTGLYFAIPTAGLAVIQSWYQGTILYGGRTRGITEAVVIFLTIITALLWAGVTWGQVTGLYWTLASFTIALLAQTIWLWYRSRPEERLVLERDNSYAILTPAESSAD